MRTPLIISMAVAFVTIFASCHGNSGETQGLLNDERRKETMNVIANDSLMSKEMMVAMMNSRHSIMRMQLNEMMLMGNHSSMMKMLKGNPVMMQTIMADMMESASSDTSMMAAMINTMLKNDQMREMMHMMTSKERTIGMKKMKGMGY